MPNLKQEQLTKELLVRKTFGRHQDSYNTSKAFIQLNALRAQEEVSDSVSS